MKRLDDLLIEKAPKFEFKASKIQAEYESLIVGMVLSLEMVIFQFKAKSDSQLVVNHVPGQYQRTSVGKISTNKVKVYLDALHLLK